MKISTLTLATLGAVAFVAAPAVAQEPTPTAQEQCRDLRTSMGATFASTFGTNAGKKNAFGKCVSARASATGKAKSEARENAAKECKETLHPATARREYGKCVSTRAKAQTNETVEEQLEATENAAKSCKAERTPDPAAFKAKYGTNENDSNAFGKCVSAKAKAQQDDQPAE